MKQLLNASDKESSYIQEKKLFLIKNEKEREMINMRYHLLPLEQINSMIKKNSVQYDELPEAKKLAQQNIHKQISEYLELYAPVLELREKRKRLYEQIFGNKIKPNANDAIHIDANKGSNKGLNQSAISPVQSTKPLNIVDYKNIHHMIR
jgi:hypothetical protein